MHNLFLGELRHHCRDVWGLDIKDKGGEGRKMAPHTPAQQRTNLERVRNGLVKRSRTALRKVRKGYLVAVAEINGVVPSPQNRFTKEAYVTGLVQWASLHTGPFMLPPVLEEDVVDFHIAQGPHDISKFRVLDRAIVTRIREDIAATVFPSWVERPPRNFGSPGHGKLKADQWRTACTVSLVITLCRLWGSSAASERERLLLDNFVHLVCAVDLATRRVTDPSRIMQFDKHMFEYLSSLRSLFSHDFVPNHHLSLHLYEFLLLFGPVHAWWAFPFERFNGLLQRLNTNNKTRDMPLTFMTYFYVGANVRWLMSSTEWPDSAEYKNMVSAFHDAFANVARGPRAASDFVSSQEDSRDESPIYDELKEKLLPRTVYNALLALLETQGSNHASIYARGRGAAQPILHNSANYIKSLRRDHMTFGTSTASRRNSFVLFTDPVHPTVDSFPRAGQISEIFLHARLEQGKPTVEPFVVLQEFKPLVGNDICNDPYRKSPDLQTRLFYKLTYSSVRVVRFEDIRCHFAALTCKVDNITTECVVARSLDRVSSFWTGTSQYQCAHLEACYTGLKCIGR
ncbi:hypothetical protein BV20DRAFT_955421 [Pilatotrama ljubarskyi]|nr:hypothetical protein BV20DRAFT_955421 [Pilatotrama ljubarskyi]